MEKNMIKIKLEKSIVTLIRDTIIQIKSIEKTKPEKIDETKISN